MTSHKNPVPTVDIIIEMERPEGGRGIVLIKRKNPPLGWALPGGFVDYGESLEDAASREALEETGLEVRDLRQFHTYSDPARDPRQHTISTVFTAGASGVPQAGDDAREIGIFSLDALPTPLAFDHEKILDDYRRREFPTNDSPLQEEATMTDHDREEEEMEPVEVHKVWGPAEMEVIKTLLDSHGIPVLTRGRVLQSVLPLSANGMGEIKILVPKKHAEIAKKIIAGAIEEHRG